ncbi:hypothetical protein [Demequina globuliformis]|uniref:hypothetical protein n=1 Tax=Demequina globuliformis TaxID=676202 RepID=UPI000782E2E0|nr:hypothetical protein [Demequina globuliformis]
MSAVLSYGALDLVLAVIAIATGWILSGDLTHEPGHRDPHRAGHPAQSREGTGIGSPWCSSFYTPLSAISSEWGGSVKTG